MSSVLCVIFFLTPSGHQFREPERIMHIVPGSLDNLANAVHIRGLPWKVCVHCHLFSGDVHPLLCLISVSSRYHLWLGHRCRCAGFFPWSRHCWAWDRALLFSIRQYLKCRKIYSCCFNQKFDPYYMTFFQSLFFPFSFFLSFFFSFLFFWSFRLNHGLFLPLFIIIIIILAP